MTRDKQFIADFENFVRQQITVNEMAMASAKQLAEEDGKPETLEAYIRYESKLDAYRFLASKFDNYHKGRDFHELPEGLIGERRYE